MIISSKIPKREKDLLGFIILCTLGGVVDKKVLTDLGASINLMPYKIFQKLGQGELKLMKMTLPLTDQSIYYSMGIIDDILVTVDKFIFSEDFVILDINEKAKLPSIIG